MTAELTNLAPEPQDETDSAVECSQKISVVIPAHNAATTLAEALNSLVAQTMSDWEAIVVDDGSTDETARIAAHYASLDSRISFVQQTKQGESAARNTGVSHCKFDWLLFLDADDWIAPTHLERMTQNVVLNPKVDAVICRSARVAADGTLIPERFFVPSGDLFPVLAKRAAFNVHACIVRKSLVEAVGKFDTSLERMPDWDLWQRIARTGAHFAQVNEILAFYRMRPDSISLDAYQVLRDGLRVLKTGHAPDSRVHTPHPSHIHGLPAAGFNSEQFYFLSWCAGLLLGQRKEPQLHLMSLIHKQGPVALFPNAIAQCIFEAAMLPLCSPPSGWEELWPQIHKQVKEFLIALEEVSEVADLANDAEQELKMLILKHSITWSPTFAKLETELSTAHEINVSLTKEKEDWVQIAEQRALVIQEQTLNAGQLSRHIEILQSESEKWRHLLEEVQALSASKEKELARVSELLNAANESLEMKGSNIDVLNRALDTKTEEIHALENRMGALLEEIASLRATINIKNHDLEVSRIAFQEKQTKWINLEHLLKQEMTLLQKLADQRKARYLHLRTQFLVRAGMKMGLLKKND